jgi:vitamin B12 transporter
LVSPDAPAYARAQTKERCVMGGRFQVFVPALAGTVLLAQAALAQDQTSNNAVVLPPIVVSATMVPTPAAEVASSVTVITSTDIARAQQRTVPDILNDVPGLNVVQTGGPGGHIAIFMRGTNSNHVKVFIDGIDAGDPSVTNGAFDFGNLLASDIERIEVLRGPQSGLYGSDAIGGVIAITTKKGEGPPKATGTLEAGSFGTFNQTARLSGSQTGFNYAFNVMHYQTASVPVTPLNLLAPGEKRNNDSYNNWTYSTKLGATLSDNLAVNLVGRYIDASHGFTGEDFLNFAPPAPEVAQSTQLNHQLFTRGELVWSLFGGKFKNYFGVSYSNQWTWYSDPNADSFYTSPLVLPPTTNVGVRTKFDWRGVAKVAPGQTLVLGLEKQTDALRTNSTGTVDMSGNFTQTTTYADVGNKAGYAELQSKLPGNVFLVSNIRYDDNDSFGGHTTYRIAPSYIVPMTDTKLKASYGTGFKAPTLNELYVNLLQYNFFANPALKPEESKGYDFGFEQPIIRDHLKFGVTYYNNDITNLIGYTATSYVNVDKSSIYGYEAFATLIVNRQFRIRADYTYTHIDATSLSGYLRKPAHKYSVTATWSPVDPLQLSATMITVSSWLDYDRSGYNTLTAPGYTVVNVAANYDVNDKVKIFGRIDNLFNRQYETPLGFDRPGFSVFGGVRVSN